MKSRLNFLGLAVLCASATSFAQQERFFTAHVLRRTSFGPTAGQVDTLALNFPNDLAAYINNQLVGPTPQSTDYVTGLADFQVPALNADPYAGPAWTIDDLSKQNLYRAVWSQRQLQELMTMFWHQTLNTNYWSVVGRLKQNPSLLAGVPGADNDEKARKAAARIIQRENEGFRQNALGNFRALLDVSAKGSAMLLYLDSFRNTDGTNENYARELMELHTLGTGLLHGFNFLYEYNDVRELARAFSGWDVMVDTSNGWPELEFFYDTAAGQSVISNPTTQPFALHEFTQLVRGANNFTMPIPTGAQTGVIQGEAVLDYLADCYETRIWICSRMMEFFIGYAPAHPLDPIRRYDSGLPYPTRKIPLPPGITELDLETVLYSCLAAWGPGAPGVLDTGDIQAVLTVILNSVPFLSTESHWARVKNPLEYQAYLLRAYNVDVPKDNAGVLNPRTALTAANNALNGDLGMALFRFPSPDGFPIHSEEVLSTSQYLYGANVAQDALTDFNIVDPFQVLGGYDDADINWDPMGFCLPGDYKGVPFNTQLTNLLDYLNNYPPAAGTLDIGKKGQLVDHVHEALFSSDVLTSSTTLTNSWLTAWEATLPFYGQAPPTQEHLTFIMTAAHPSNPVFNLALDIWGRGMVGLMSAAAAAPQAFLK